MRKVSITFAAGCLSLTLLAVACVAQDKSIRPSPPATASVDLGAASVTINYSSPRLKGRQVGGEVAPFGKVWRAGANEATTFVASGRVAVGGKIVPAGSYTIFAIPDKDKWTLIISKKTGEWGTDYPGEAEDVARVDMKVSTLPASIENFTISFDKSDISANLNRDWGTTRASARITTVADMSPLILPSQRQAEALSPVHRNMGLVLMSGTGEADFEANLKQISLSLRKKWMEAMPDSVLQGQKGRVILEFGINEDGTILDQLVRTTVSSGNQTLDDAAIAAIRNAAPFDRLPISYAGPRVSKISLRMTFLYNLPIPPRP